MRGGCVDLKDGGADSTRMFKLRFGKRYFPLLPHQNWSSGYNSYRQIKNWHDVFLSCLQNEGFERKNERLYANGTGNNNLSAFKRLRRAEAGGREEHLSLMAALTRHHLD